jgi:L-arabinokinase
MRERGERFAGGARLLIHSDVPEGKGVSSSAAIEVASMQAIAAAYGITLDPRELAILCQKVENLVVGAPCGVMDQMTASCGQADELLALSCQPAELREPVAIPRTLSLWGIDSGIRHAVSGSDYMSVRVGAFMGYRIIADLAGLNVQDAGEEGIVTIQDGEWGGYLANLSPVEFAQRFADRLPDEMVGRDFLDRYQGTSDRVARIDPGRMYAVARPTAHPVFEHERVRRWSELLQGGIGDAGLFELGRLMYESHESYSACGLGSDGTDRLVELVRQAGRDVGLYGARITGGGSGGTVAVLGSRDAGDAVRKIAERYANETGRDPYVFGGSSPGSASFGHLKLSAGGADR